MKNTLKKLHDEIINLHLSDEQHKKIDEIFQNQLKFAENDPESNIASGLDESSKILARIKGNEKELCVYCKNETNYSYNTPAQMRNFYVEGAGQLCKTCYNKIYNTI